MAHETILPSRMFHWIHSLLNNSYLPTTCYHQSISTNPHISSWLFGFTLACVSQIFITSARVVYSKKNSLVTNYIFTCIVIANSMGILFSWLDQENSLCIDFLGVELSPYLMFEWLITVPAMFFLTPFYSMDTVEKQRSVIQTAIMAGVSILFLALGNFQHASYIMNMLFFSASVVLMIGALVRQLLFTWTLFQEATSAFAKFSPKKRLSEAYMTASSMVDVTLNQFTLAVVMTLAYIIIPVVYGLRITHYFDFETFTIAIFGTTFLSKFLYSHVLVEVSNAVLDYSVLNTLEEKQRQADCREMLLRFVFHEIRVPLNSLTLGIQFLKEKEQSEQQAESGDGVGSEVLDMMQEGAHFMSETLNDVLSFQKIEDGALTLDQTWFDPRKLLKTISATFK